MNANNLREKRLLLLFELDRLLYQVDYNENVDEAVEQRIEQIGKMLIELVRPRKRIRKKLEGSKHHEPIKLEEIGITVEEYKRLRESGLKDKEIAHALNVCSQTLNKWKGVNGLRKQIAKKGEWAKDKVDYLVHNHDRLTLREMSLILGKKLQDVEAKCKVLGIECLSERR